MKYLKLKEETLKANLTVNNNGLVLFTWGNVSIIDRNLEVIAIKPSGVPYSQMTADDIVVVNLEGKVVSGKLKPSVDLNTHLVLYKEFENINSIVHTHSTYATAFAQKALSIPIMGTTHADYFTSDIPCVRYLKENEMKDYEKSTGIAITETFKNLNYNHIPGCVVSGHGVFAWGKSGEEAVFNATVLEQIAKMAYLTLTLPGENKTLPKHMSDTHYERKHGKNKTYGQ